MKSKLFAALVVVTSIFYPLTPLIVKADVAKTVVINQIVAGTSNSASEELVELYNYGEDNVDISGWKLKFISSSNNAKELAEFNSVVGPKDAALLTSTSYLVPSGIVSAKVFPDSTLTYNGHLELSDETGSIVDVVGWGSALSYEGTALPAMAGGKVLHRFIDCEDKVIDTDNNADDFFSDNNVLYDRLPSTTKTTCVMPNTDCENIIISEILPNPGGSDSGNEFVEIYNPTGKDISLTGCGISLNSSDSFDFAGEIIVAGEFKAFFDDETKITLPNSSGGEVSFYTTGFEYAVNYPGDLGDDVSWALIDGFWVETNQPSPNAPNLPNLSAEEAGKGSTELEPCPEGKFRNPETNRCKNIETEDGIKPCDSGQERNPETNRCRKVGNDQSSLKPCNEGEERNPDTNRCRKVAGATTPQTPCKAGYERNPETNRCRKISTSGASSALTNTAVAGQSPVSYPVLGITTAIAGGYGVFEYRHDILNWLSKLKKR